MWYNKLNKFCLVCQGGDFISGKFIDLAQAGALLGIPASTLRRWLVEEKIPGIRIAGGKWRIAVTTIEKILARANGSEKISRID